MQIANVDSNLGLADGYGTEDVRYIWTHGNDDSIKMASDMTLSQFDLIGFPAGNETLRSPSGNSYNTIQLLLLSDNY